MNIVVLGCGPSGLMAAHAVAELGHDVKIVSKKRKSEMYGAQYLHERIPGIDCGRAEHIRYQLNGTADGYRDKVYGPGFQGKVSPEELEEDHIGWDIRRAYDQLWDMYSEYVIDMPIHATDLTGRGLVGQLGADLVISSLPAPVICLDRQQHTFFGQEVYAIGDAPERGIANPISAPPFTVVCNGDPNCGWYRTANVFGSSTTEWPLHRKPPYEGVAKIVKPLRTDCDCYINVRRVGRYGQWKKGVLAHTAYTETHAFLVNQGNQEALF